MTASNMRLDYYGKKSIHEILQMPPGDITPLGRTASPNRLIFSDNLDALIRLAYDRDVVGKVKMVYIDPPFSTNGRFYSRDQVYAYQDLRIGPDFIEFLRERLVWLHHIMADEGSLYVHIDERMVSYLRVVLDEIFGSNMFRNCIVRKKSNPKNYTRNTYGNVVDYILFYTKSDNYVWHRPVEPWTDEGATKEYPYLEEGTGKRYKRVPLHAPGVRHGETGKRWRGQLPPPGKHWQYPPSRLDELDANGEIYWSANGNPRRKLYFDDTRGLPVQNIWLEYKDAHNQNVAITGYPTEKPPALLQRIILASSNPGDLVLDCFSGSGTTLAVANDLNRFWIGIDNSPEAIKSTLKRFAYGLEPMGDYVRKSRTSAYQQSLLNQTPQLLVENFAPWASPDYVDFYKSIISESEYGHFLT